MAPDPDDEAGQDVEIQLLGHVIVTLSEYCVPAWEIATPVTEPALFTTQVPERPFPALTPWFTVNLDELLVPSPGM